MHTYSEKPQMDRRCMSRQLVTEVLLTKTPWSFHALFLFSHIFLLSHTFVDILCCFGQMYVRDHVSVLSCLLSTADDFAVFHFSLHCRPVFSFCWCLFSIYLLLINVLRPHCICSFFFFLSSRIKSVSPFIFLLETNFFFFFFSQAKEDKKKKA